MIDEIIAKAKRTKGLLTPSETLIVVATLDRLVDAILLTPTETQYHLFLCLNQPTKSTSPESKPEPTET